MNIVFHRYNSICEPGYIEAFKALGIDIIEDTYEITHKSISGKERIERMGELVLTNKPLFVFTINFFPYISEICERLKVLYVCVSVDCPVAELLSVSIRNKCNRVFLFDYHQYTEVADENPGHIFHMPLSAYNTDRTERNNFKYDVSFVGSLYNEKNPYSEIYPGLPEDLKGYCDGLLAAQECIGGLDLIETVLDDNSHSIGDNIAFNQRLLTTLDKYVPDDMHDNDAYITDMTHFVSVQTYLGIELTVRDRLTLLASLSEYLGDTGTVHLFTRSDTSILTNLTAGIRIHGGVNTLNEMPEVFMRSKININTTMRPIRTGLSQRIWDVLGVGGFLLTNYQSEIPEYLEIGKHLEAYETIDEACEKAAYYLEHEDERMEIAENGYREVLEKHTILNRVKDMIAIILKTME